MVIPSSTDASAKYYAATSFVIDYYHIMVINHEERNVMEGIISLRIIVSA